MQKRKLISSGSRWEDVVGYSRAVRVGNVVEVSGTTAVNGDEIVGRGNVYQQTVFILEKIKSVLHQAGSGMEDVVRTRMFVTDISRWEEIGKAHALYFQNIKPVTSMVEVSRLIDPELLIEIEVTAIIDNT